MNVMLVCDSYVPNENDTPASVTPYILNGVSAIVNDYFSANVMSNILDTIKAKMELGFQMFPDVIAAQIELKVTDTEKKEKLKQLIQMSGDNKYQFWKDLKDNGISWFVLESTEHGVLIFAEEL
jgi:phage gp36-like protein